jgi:hypothetical protein
MRFKTTSLIDTANSPGGSPTNATVPLRRVM